MNVLGFRDAWTKSLWIHRDFESWGQIPQVQYTVMSCVEVLGSLEDFFSLGPQAFQSPQLLPKLQTLT